MTPPAQELAAALDEGLELHQRLLDLTVAQREVIAAGQVEVVDGLSRDIEAAALRLGAVEERRQRAAAALADAHGLAATRWSVLRDALDAGERAALDPRVGRLEALVRDLELANAVNGQLIRRQLDLVDRSMRALGGVETTARRYTARGALAAAPGARPLLLNTTA